MILWEKEALKDRQIVFEYLYEFNSIAAEKTDDILINKIKNLLHQPSMGVERVNLKGRLLIIPEISMLVSYYTDNKDIKILRILHIKQKYPQ
ncbi:plasmid stabilization protein ParE [Marinomonas ushuaiensis DSM 15871]|uniref:Plasmid stabilization protein ParE n=1 Tax=Marinomonas ushuaiensis DSM 15871 TaxID=1122207 RepID=X7E8U4_9GAMM|nr:type II toxin-antitoxin system RelE/ParE family toxin [Marinomonas ushuaiensis]ETX12479.1 plasmid stabilization protein ParE [Marinomonas ushuaiensis DSM 15871]